MRKMYTILMISLLIVFVLGMNSTHAQTVLKAGHAVDPDHPYHLGLEKFDELLREKTDGEIKLDIYHSGQLGSERDLIEGMKMGTGVDVAVSSTAPIASFIPKIAVFDLPYLFTSREHAYKVLDGPVGNQFIEDLSDQFIEGFGYFENGFRNVTNSVRPIENPEDLEGIKIRVQENEVPVKTFEAFGANPTPMDWGGVFTALQQGTIDAQENPLPVIYSQKIYEVQEYLSLTRHFYSPALLMMSEREYESFSKEKQKIIDESARKAIEYQRKKSQEFAEEYISDLEEYMKVNEVNINKFQEAAEPVYDEFEDDFGNLIEKIISQ